MEGLRTMSVIGMVKHYKIISLTSLGSKFVRPSKVFHHDVKITWKSNYYFTTKFLEMYVAFILERCASLRTIIYNY